MLVSWKLGGQQGDLEERQLSWFRQAISSHQSSVLQGHGRRQEAHLSSPMRGTYGGQLGVWGGTES